MKKFLTLPLVAAMTVAATPAMAEISANIGASSNYLWRGVSQSANSAAVSGGVDYSDKSGVYAGTWVSNIDGGHELDLYFGYSGEVEGIGYDVGYLYYGYPQKGTADGDFAEIYFNASYSIVSGGIASTISSGDSNDGGAFDSGDLYLHISVGTELEDNWSWSATYGMYDFTNDGDLGVGDISYAHYQLDLVKSLGDAGDFSFTLSGAEKESGNNDPQAVVGWSKGF